LSGERVERRLAAILAADIAGYSRLMGRDEAGTLARLRAHRRELIDPRLDEHKGRIVKTTGDGLLIEFPSVVEAVTCAVAVQRGMTERNIAVPEDQQIVFRVGINLGDIIIADDNDIHGDGVNVAARLEGIAEPGGICVSATVRDHIGDRLDLAFEDMGEQALKNIARPLRVYRIKHATAETTPAATPIASSAALALPDKPSIAVLPFQNMSGDPEQEYFADGMVEEITTAISRLPWLFVIARNSSFTYKGKPIDVKQVARELGVRYVLEGSVRKAANRVRITGQLIDAATGNHIWADRFDGALDDIFELQDRVASGVAGAIEPKLRQSEIERATRKPTASLDAYDLYLRGLAQVHRFTAESVGEAIRLLRQALVVDPSYPPAAALLGWCFRLRLIQGWGAVSQGDIAEAVRLARQASEAGRDDPDVIWQAAITLAYLAGESAFGAAIVDRALALNPNAANAWAVKGWMHALANQPEPAIDALAQARRLSPFDPLAYWNATGSAIAHIAARQFETALEWAERALHDQPRAAHAVRAKVVANAHLGRLDEARAALSQLLVMHPGLTIAGWKSTTPGISPEFIEIYETGLRLAGLPDG